MDEETKARRHWRIPARHAASLEELVQEGTIEIQCSFANSLFIEITLASDEGIDDLYALRYLDLI